MTVLLVILLSASSLAGAAIDEAGEAAARGDWEAAATAYGEAVREDPSSYEARFGLARSLAFSGRRDEAIDAYTAILEDSPSDPDALLGRGRVHSWEDDWEEAEADITAVTASHPDYADAWSALGDLYLWSGRPDDALTAYTKRIDLTPDDPSPYISRARAYKATGSIPLAEADLERAEELGGDAETIGSVRRSLAPSGGDMPWEASFSYGFREFSPDRADWHLYRGRISREIPFGSVALEWSRHRRFSRWDEMGGIDAYIDLVPSTYANLRWFVAPDHDFLARNDYMIEVFRGLGGGWEASLLYRHMDFPENGVDIYGGSMARYLGDWYLRGRYLSVPGQYGGSENYALLARRYLRTEDDFIEVEYAFGTKPEEIRTREDLSDNRTDTIRVRFETYLTLHSGIMLQGRYRDLEGSPVERGFSTGLMYRW